MLSTAIIFVALLAFIFGAHPFLAITKRANANVLVVEGWIPHQLLEEAIVEFVSGNYRYLIVSGFADTTSNKNTPFETSNKLMQLGLDPSRIIACPTPISVWNKTGTMARAVRERIGSIDIDLKGVNVLTRGTHARQTRVAYRRILKGTGDIGVISIPYHKYDIDYWWLSKMGWVYVLDDTLGYFKELILGYRS